MTVDQLAGVAEERARQAWVLGRRMESQLEPFQRNLLSDVYVAMSALARSLEE